MSNTLSKRIVSAKAGDCPFPLPQVGGQHTQPIYAIRAHEVDELTAEIERLRADAARYRAIRDGCGADLYATLAELDGAALDAAIDAAIAAREAVGPCS